MASEQLALLKNSGSNKGMGFTETEREKHNLHGFLPPAILSQSVEAERIMMQLRAKHSPLEKYIFLQNLQNINEHLYFRVLVDHIHEVMPLVYTPTVGEACVKFSQIFIQPRGLFLSTRHQGHFADILKLWPHRNVKAIVFTDGERILGLGDLGANGMGIPIGKLALYTACAGVAPQYCLPVLLDAGTNNQAALQDPAYIGLKQPRLTGKPMDDMVEEFMTAAADVFGRNVLLQFEDFGNSNAFRYLERYRDQFCTFNDDIQGTASVSLAGMLAAMPLTGKKGLGDHTFLFVGAGEAGCGIAALLASAMAFDGDVTEEEARKRIFMTDSKGLVTTSRLDQLAHHKRPFAQDQVPESDLLAIVRRLRPSVLVGVSAQAGCFTTEVLEAMAEINDRPVIMALSNPTSKAECTAEQAYVATGGRAVFASGSPFDPVTLQVNGQTRTLVPGQGNNAYIFPGVALGVIESGCVTISDRMFIVAAKALADQVTAEDLASGRIYPALSAIREVSAVIATAVAEHAYDTMVANAQPRPADMLAHMRAQQYHPRDADSTAGLPKL